MASFPNLAQGRCDLPVHILIATLARGGAERAVAETVEVLQEQGALGNLFVLGRAQRTYAANDTPHFRFFPAAAQELERSLAKIARQIVASPVKLVLTHLVPARELQILWREGVQTVPVIHNMSGGWQDPPAAFSHSMVPFLAADSCAVARELRERGCTNPVIVVRHELQHWLDAAEIARNRATIRARYGIADDEFLVGMVGNFKAQKAYPRAMRVLERLIGLVRARMIILGSWDHSYGYGNVTYEVTCALAKQLGVEDELILAGGVEDVEAHYAAFDAFLSTSIHEGLSVAMLEAQNAGCPVVTADAGGNAEALGPCSQLVLDPSDIQGYVEALLRVRGRRSPPPAPPAYPRLIPQLWRQLAIYSTPAVGHPIVFVTNSLNNGGSTRSLVHLLTRYPHKERVLLCILGLVHNDGCLEELHGAAVSVVRFGAPASAVDCTERVLALVRSMSAGTLCFWNVDAAVKLLTTKVLAAAGTRIIDVSPGPTLFQEMRAAADFQRRIAFTPEEYFARLDGFVAKYRAGAPPSEYNLTPERLFIIPNGVPCPPEAESVPFPDRFAEAFRLVTCCRLAPEKRVEFLVDSAAEVSQCLPETSLTVVGGPERGNHAYTELLAQRAQLRGLQNTWFTGRQPHVTPFLSCSRVFVSASRIDGCSNAINEAMAAALPVVASSNPAVAEQVEHGVTGYLVSADRPDEMAERISTLLTNPEKAREFGAAGRRKVQRSFGIDRMVHEYARLLAP